MQHWMLPAQKAAAAAVAVLAGLCIGYRPMVQTFSMSVLATLMG
jgi:hypothetical protein